jgi:hypothetical protein
LPFTPLQAQIAVRQSWANTADRAARTAKARAAAEARLAQMADPEGVLSKEDRAKAVENLRRLHLLKMSQKASRQLRAFIHAFG